MGNILNTLRPRQHGRHFPDDIFKYIFLNDDVWIFIEISLKFVPNGLINNIPALVQIMDWRRPGDKPLSEPMMARLPTHICAGYAYLRDPHLVFTVPTDIVPPGAKPSAGKVMTTQLHTLSAKVSYRWLSGNLFERMISFGNGGWDLKKYFGTWSYNLDILQGYTALLHLSECYKTQWQITLLW